MYYIKETDKPSKFAEFFHIVKLENDMITLPITETSLDEKTAYKLAIKTKTILDKTNSKKLVLSKKIKEQEIYLVPKQKSKNITVSYCRLMLLLR